MPAILDPNEMYGMLEEIRGHLGTFAENVNLWIEHTDFKTYNGDRETLLFDLDAEVNDCDCDMYALSDAFAEEIRPDVEVTELEPALGYNSDHSYAILEELVKIVGTLVDQKSNAEKEAVKKRIKDYIAETADKQFCRCVAHLAQAPGTEDQDDSNE